MKPHIYLFQGEYYCDSDWPQFKCSKKGKTWQEAHEKWLKAARNIKYLTQMVIG